MDYRYFGVSELTERLERYDDELSALVRDWDFGDSQKMQSEIIKLLKSK